MLALLLARFSPGQYAGSKTCAACHPHEFAAHSKTAHARALSRSDKADWAFGAGDQAITYVSRLNEDFYIEHGLSYFASSKAMKITPGHLNEHGKRYRIFDPDAAILRCFQCHSTGSLHLGDDFRIEPSEPGVQCEACHGPGSDHKTIRNPRKMTPAQINDLCGTCHRTPASAGSDTDFSDPWNVRHQPLYLAESACFKKGKVSCLTCHAAHQPVSKVAADYDAKCKSCHRTAHRGAARSRSCVSCHMREVRPHEDLRFVNHWIR